MSDKFYYLESLDTVQLENKKSWLNIHRVGTWSHPVYKKVEGSIEKFQKMIENFENKVIGRDVPMDTRHGHGESLGWVEKLKIVGDKLMALVAWTPLGEKAVKERIWKYISPEYDENYEDKETGTKYGPALLAIAATNFPFLTKLEPMALSEDLERDEELKKLLIKEEDHKLVERNLSESHLRILNSIEGADWNQVDDDEIIFILGKGGLTIPQTRALNQVIYLPYPNEHACRIREPNEFQVGSFRRITGGSKKGKGSRDGKRISIIIGKLKGKATTTTQAYRYPIDTWTESQARDHCSENKGRFEPAGEST